MANSILQFTDNGGLGGQFPVTATFDANVHKGSLIVVCAACVIENNQSVITLQDTQDNDHTVAVVSEKLFPESGNSGFTGRFLIATAVAKADGSLSVTIEGNSFGVLTALNMYEASGPTELDVIGLSDVQTVASTALATVSTASAAQAGDLVIAFFVDCDENFSNPDNLPELTGASVGFGDEHIHELAANLNGSNALFDLSTVLLMTSSEGVVTVAVRPFEVASVAGIVATFKAAAANDGSGEPYTRADGARGDGLTIQYTSELSDNEPGSPVKKSAAVAREHVARGKATFVF